MFSDSKRALLGISFGHFILDLYAAILIPLYPMISANLGMNIAKISMIIAIGHMTSSLLQPVFGYISDKLNIRIFLFLGMLFCSVFFPIAINSPSGIFLTICLILGITGNAFYHPQATIILKEYSLNQLELSKFMGIFLGLGTIGYSFGPYLSTYFVETFGQAKYILISLVGILTLLIMLILVPKIKTKNEVLKESFLDIIKEILQNKICLFLILIAIIKSTLIMSFGTYIPFILKSFDFSLKTTGLIMTLFFIMGGLSMIVSSKIEKYIKLKGIILASFVPILPLTLLFLYSIKINKISAICLIITTGFFVLLQAGVVLAHAQRLISKSSGVVSGIIQGFSLSVGSLLLIPFGFIAQSFGVGFVLILVSTVAFILSLFALRLKF